jgi:phytoene synthase
MPLLSAERPKASPADIEACRDLLRGGSRSFFVASFLLPRAVRDPAVSLYAFCRMADDAIDLDASGGNALARLRERLERLYEGRPVAIPADRALADVVARFGVPRAVPEALLEGFAWDAEGRRYEDIGDLHAYAARVAGTVGVMMTLLMGERSPAVVSRACDLGMAMQLSNIARDVGEDARNGRLYLPLTWMREAGLDPDEWLAQPVFNEALAEVVRRLLREADTLYDRAGAGIARLPLSCQPGIWAARYLYAEIGREVERAGYDSVSQRAVVSARRKARLLGRALAAPVLPVRQDASPTLPAARFLIDAVVAHPARGRVKLGADSSVTDRSFGEQVGWVIQLFAKLEQLERMEAQQRRRRAVAVVSSAEWSGPDMRVRAAE